MNLNTISYWFIEAFASMKKNMKNVMISVSTMLATMLIVAVGYIVLMNSNYIIEQKQEANSKIMAYLDIDVTDEEVENIDTRIKALDGVLNVKYYSQADAINEASKIDEILVKGYSDDALKSIYQPFFKISFETVEAEGKIISLLKSLDGVGENSDDIVVSESAEKSIKEAKSMKIVAITAMILIIELSVFLMMNSTKLMLYARRKEISIMKYVGAKDSFVKMPFAIEGILMSLVAVFIVVVLVCFLYEPITGMIGKRASYKYLELSEIMSSLKMILIGVGIFIGAIGSTASMNKYLDV